jgi:predicted  nucleic acid-binding Zn-ribbon protein
MPGLTDVFREIHRLRRYTTDLQVQIDRVPRQLKIQQAKVAHQEKLLSQGQDELKRLKVTIHEKEVSLKTAHQQIAKHRKQLNEATAKKEFDALVAEIKQDEDKCQRLEDEILQAMTDSDDQAARVPQLEQGVRQAKEEYARYEQGVEERLASLRAQLAEAQEQLRQAEEQIPENVRERYDRVVKALGPDALAPVTNRTCSACHTGITAQHYNELQIGTVVMCKSCGRILYLPESSSS